MSDFKAFSQAVHAQFTAMSAHELFVVDIDPDELYAAYLAAFPEGTNPIFRERTEHDCSCCRNFIKNLGPVVAIIDGRIVTVWDLSTSVADIDPCYQQVALALATLIESKPIKSLYRTDQHIYGAEQSKELRDDGTVHTWNHFHGKVANKHFSTAPGAAIGDYAGNVQVFRRGLEELAPAALETVMDLVEANNLYKGAEYRPALQQFQLMQAYYRGLSPEDQVVYVFSNAMQHGARIRNTAIGTLLIDLSAGVELEKAVKSFEDKVSGTNYKRPSALITPRMVADAMKTIEAEGLEPSLARRLAHLSDITMNNVLWADNSIKAAMKGGIAGLLMDAASRTETIDADKAEAIGIEDFLVEVLPRATSLDLLVQNHQQGNFMTLTTAEHASAPFLFKWDNTFAWSYDGNITDSIKERVKAAGGKTDAVLRVSLAWYNHDDLDIHVFEPDGHRIYFGNKRVKSRNSGMLDVDMNAGGGTTREPVENVVWDNPGDGKYLVHVNNYQRREPTNPGFTLEVESVGTVTQYSCVMSPNTGKTANCLTITVKDRKVVNVEAGANIVGRSISQTKWGVTTETLVKVKTVLLSPNYWDGNKVGNQHTFFILEGCATDTPMRGLYNEFLRSDLEKHRKVFEVLGNRTMCPPTAEQLSGLGFSSTKRDSVLVSVAGGKLRKTYSIQF